MNTNLDNIHIAQGNKISVERNHERTKIKAKISAFKDLN